MYYLPILVLLIVLKNPINVSDIVKIMLNQFSSLVIGCDNLMM